MDLDVLFLGPAGSAPTRGRGLPATLVRPGHSTARQAGELAAAANVAMLALTHFSPRYPPAELHAEALTAFEATVVPRDVDRVEIPLPERGGPVHESREGRPESAPDAAAEADSAG